MLEVVPLTERIGAEIKGVDLSRDLNSAEIEAIYSAWIDHTIILFRGQKLTPEQHIAFTHRIGEVVSYTRTHFSADSYPEILVLSNIQKDGKLIGSPVSGRVWHTDGHYLEDPPAGSLLYAIETPPEGGDTMFANMVAAYEDLPEVTKRQIENLEVIISRVQSRPYNYPDRPPPTEAERKDWVDVHQPMVIRHPVSGRKAIYAGGSVPWRIAGMDEARSAPLVTFVQEFSIMPQYVYRHQWQPGDLIIWDNRSAMHRATPYDELRHRRLMHRTTVGSRLPDVTYTPGGWADAAGLQRAS